MKKDFTETLEQKWFRSLVPTEVIPSVKLVNTKSKSSKKKSIKTTELFFTKTFRISENHSIQINALAYRRRKKIQDIFHDALETYLLSVPKNELNDALEAYKEL